MFGISSLLCRLKFTPARTDITVVLTLPSSLEAVFNKISYSKGLSLLIKREKINYFMMFAVSKQKIREMLEEFGDYFQDDCVLWIAFPKKTSRIITNLKKDRDWDLMEARGYTRVTYLMIDNVWGTFRFQKVDQQKIYQWLESQKQFDISHYLTAKGEIIALHPSLEKLFEEDDLAYNLFKALIPEEKASYLCWIHSSDNEMIVNKRIQDAVRMIHEGVLNPFLAPED